jgi:tRNA A37 methylthiotransferase MiaB
MNRKYDVRDFLYIVNSFKNKFPNITISTDIIVGFPSETNEQFYNSINLLNIIKPDIVNITRFSSRPNTKAKLMSNRIKTEISKDRSRILSKISNKISDENNKSYIGKIINGLVIENGKNNTKLCRTDNYKPVIIRDKVELGEFIKIQIIDSTQNYLVGNII